jgi:phosphatidylserine/phosphatidylglycerophosphate/cardiolipin synthase-like enzyme
MAATCQLLPQQVCVLHDDLGVTARAGTISKKIDQIIDAAQQSIVIETPYPAFSNEFFGRLRAAVNRGVMVTLITNSLRSTNQVEVFAAYQNQKSRLLQMGVQIYEYRGPDHLHAKAMIVDDRLAMLGSYNFDARSERLNLELCLLTHNPTAVMLIREAIGFHQCQTKAICTVSESDTLNDASLMRRLRMRTAQFIVPLLRPAL